VDNYFSTTDLSLASFLDMSGIDLREVKESEMTAGQFKFEFRIEKDSDKLKVLLDEWDCSERAKNLKRFAYSNKKMRAELKIKLTDYNG
jgi:hypothetical protein